MNNFLGRWGTGEHYRLFELVDFISPHNYGGRADEMIDHIRAWTGEEGEETRYVAVVLEEFGYPTDSDDVNPNYDEDIAIKNIRRNQSAISGENLDPDNPDPGRVVEAGSEYAGSSFFMLADLDLRKPGDKKCGNPNSFHFFTGLFTDDNTDYCGGTRTFNEDPLYPGIWMKKTGPVIANFYANPTSKACETLLRLFLPLIQR